MEIDYLKEFIVLAETGNYLRAAETLFISQSSLSKHIKSLENEAGISLFHRTTHKVELTGQGQTLLKYAKQIADLQCRCAAELARQSGAERQVLNIGSIPVMAPYRITDVIMKFQKENPQYSVQLYEEESSRLKELLRRNQCDLAFIRDGEEEPDDEFTRLPFTTDRLVAVLPAAHPLAGSHHLTLEQLKEEHFLFLPPDTLLYSLCQKACAEAGFTPRVTYTGKRAENIMDLVKKNMGVSLLMEKPIRSLSTESVSIIPITPKISTRIQIYYKKELPLPKAAKQFVLSAL